MSQEGNKYKIQIVKAGIGDPFLLITAQFLDNDGYDPTTNPIDDLEVKIGFAYSPDDDLYYFWKGYSNNISEMGPYRFGIPFDRPDDWNEGRDVYIRIIVEKDGDDNFDVDSTGNNQVDIHFATLGGARMSFYDDVYYSYENPV